MKISIHEVVNFLGVGTGIGIGIGIVVNVTRNVVSAVFVLRNSIKTEVVIAFVFLFVATAIQIVSALLATDLAYFATMTHLRNFLFLLLLLRQMLHLLVFRGILCVACNRTRCNI